MIVPIIDVSPLFQEYSSEEERETAKRAVAQQIGKAAEEIGFLIIVGHQVPKQVIDDAWTAIHEFFDLPLDEKMKYVYPQNIYPFGYAPLNSEILSTGKTAELMNSTHRKEAAIEYQRNEKGIPDLKEMFSIGPDSPLSGFPTRIYPTQPADFERAIGTYYNTLANLASRILECFAIALNLPDQQFFEQFLDHHASALRAIHYPEIKSPEDAKPGQLRASAHTDYGTITILRTDGPGLQVAKDVDPPIAWHDVPHVENCFVINLGDLMRRWTNDRWLSTLHQVVIPSDQEYTRRRQSLAFFHNVNRDSIITPLLNGEADEPKHPPIVAGDFLLQKHLASMGQSLERRKSGSGDHLQHY